MAVGGGRVGGIIGVEVADGAAAVRSDAVKSVAGVTDGGGNERARIADRVRAGDAVVGARVSSEVRVEVAARRTAAVLRKYSHRRGTIDAS